MSWVYQNAGPDPEVVDQFSPLKKNILKYRFKIYLREKSDEYVKAEKGAAGGNIKPPFGCPEQFTSGPKLHITQ